MQASSSKSGVPVLPRGPVTVAGSQRLGKIGRLHADQMIVELVGVLAPGWDPAITRARDTATTKVKRPTKEGFCEMCSDPLGQKQCRKVCGFDEPGRSAPSMAPGSE